jgi:hypothetical protein
MRRAAAFDLGLSHLQGLLFMFAKAVAIENLHPLQGGIWRRKYRLDRRHGLPIEPAWRFYPKATWEVVRKVSFMARYWLQLDRMRRAVQRDPNKRAYMDAALQPVDEHDVETLAMFTHNEGARSEVARTKRIHDLTHGGGHEVPAGA